MAMVKAVEAATSYIQHNYHTKISVKDLAGMVHISEVHFNRLFKKHMGITPHKYINSIRLIADKELLSATPHPNIYNIVTQCGFSSTEDFSRSFKKAFHITPSEYRRSTRT